MIRYLVTGVIAILASITAQGQVVVELLSMPKEIYSLEPVYVLYSIENIGDDPIYLPAERAPERGHGLYIGRNGEPPKPVNWVLDARIYPHTEATMWLAPGERWLFYREIGWKVGLLEGEASIQAVLSSDGPCGDRLRYGRHQFPLKPLHVESVQIGVVMAEVYRCWQGEARSNVWTLKVRRSDSLVDRKAYEYLLADGRLVENHEQGYWSMRWGPMLKEKYPSSHYTFASLAEQSSVYAKKEATDLQPDNPLNPWVMGAVADLVLKRRSRCSTDPPLTFDLNIEELELPDGVRGYLDQQKWYFNNRYCQERQSLQSRSRERRQR